jgi:hypothetical protein
MAAPLADDFSSIQARLLQIQTDEGRRPAAPRPAGDEEAQRLKAWYATFGAVNGGLPRPVFGENQED